MTEHSRLPPSSAVRRVACPGSRALEEKYPEDQESPYAREGHAAHWVAANMLKDVPPLESNEPITDEMVEGAEMYVDYIGKVLKDLSKKEDIRFVHSSLYVEERIDIKRIHPDCWGTPDAWFCLGTELHIFDYKYGHGYVEVFENWQLIEYAAGILDKLEINGIQDRRLNVTLHIIQPRSFHRLGPIRSWRMKASDLRPYFNILEKAELEASQDYAVCKPNPECNYCLGRHACEALQRSTLTTIDVVEMNTPFDLKPASLGNELRYLRRSAALLDARITGLEQQATATIKRGERVPFFKLESNPGGKRWKVPAEEVIALGSLLGYELSKPAQVVTPIQAAKKGMSDDLIASYVEIKPGALKLIEDDGSDARKIFGVNKT